MHPPLALEDVQEVETKSLRKRVKIWEMIEVIDIRLIELKWRRSDFCAARTMRLNLLHSLGTDTYTEA